MHPLRNDGIDVQVVETASLDRPDLYDGPWLVCFANGQIDAHESEEAACAFQRKWRRENGMDPLTGEPVPCA